MLDPLVEVQKEFCLFSFDSQLRIGVRKEITEILSGQRGSDINMYQMQPAKIIIRRLLETLPIGREPKQVVEDFLVNPGSLIYDEIAFTPAKTPITTLNYWIPPGIKPVNGDWSVIGKFLLKVICDNDRELFAYLMEFLAHMWQKPEEKPGIMIVLLGGQGTGKGTLFNLLQCIWSRTTLQVSAIEHVVGGFNAAMERNYIINMDEALFSGDKKSMDRLKSMITEPSITIEQKYQPRRTIKSLHRFFAASNHDHFGNIELDDRRFVFLRVSEKRKGDHEYFKKLYTAINDPTTLEAFADFLATMNITNFNFRAKPNTSELTKQKIKSLKGFGRYWHEVLCLSDLCVHSDSGAALEWQDAQFVSTKTLMDNYRLHQSKARNFDVMQNTEVTNGIKKWCPYAVDGRKSLNKTQRRGYQLPSLDDARVAFEVAIGGKIDWGDDAE